MDILFWIALGVSVLALVMIPVMMSHGRRIQQNARPIQGEVVRVEEVKRTAISGASDTTLHYFLVHVRFPDPVAGTPIERTHVLSQISTAGDPHRDFPVGKHVSGFYEPGSPNVILADKLPDPRRNLPSLLIIAGVAGAVAVLAKVLG